AMSGPECGYCADVIAQAEELHASGGWIEGGTIEFDIDAAEAKYPSANEPTYLVSVVPTEQQFTVHRPDGTATVHQASTYQQAVFSLIYNGSRFIVNGAEVAE
ncbi:MAG: DUF6318 family protein, partial [Beutenbergiaceae bacterium]